MSFIVFIYSLFSVYSHFACKHLSVRFCPKSNSSNSEEGITQSANQQVPQFSVFPTHVTETTAVALVEKAEVNNPILDVPFSLDYNDMDHPLEKVTGLTGIKFIYAFDKNLRVRCILKFKFGRKQLKGLLLCCIHVGNAVKFMSNFDSLFTMSSRQNLSEQKRKHLTF
jgi:hypothetical protein